MTSEDSMQSPAPLPVPVREVHDPLLRFVEDLYDEPSPVKQFVGGFSLTVKSVKFLLAHRHLWPNVAIPAAINLVLFLSTASYMLLQSGPIMDWLWSRPEGLLLGLWWLVRLVVMAVLLVVSYFLIMIVGSIVASPFNDMLSEETENLLRGHVVKAEEEGLRGNAEAIMRSAVMSVVVAVLYMVCMVPLFMLGLIPVVGSIASTVLGAGVSAYFLAVEYSDYPLERRRYAFKEKFQLVWKHRKMTLGFGLGTSMLLWIPLLNFLSMPIAVIGGTAVGLSLDGRAKQDDLVQG